MKQENVRLRHGTKPKFVLMGSCQNHAYYLSVCSLTRSVGNLIIHCSSLLENMHSKCPIFTYFIFLVSNRKEKGHTYMPMLYLGLKWKKNPLLLLKSSMSGVQLEKILIDGLWSIFKGIIF